MAPENHTPRARLGNELACNRNWTQRARCRARHHTSCINGLGTRGQINGTDLLCSFGHRGGISPGDTTHETCNFVVAALEDETTYILWMKRSTETGQHRPLMILAPSLPRISGYDWVRNKGDERRCCLTAPRVPQCNSAIPSRRIRRD